MDSINLDGMNIQQIIELRREVVQDYEDYYFSLKQYHPYSDKDKSANLLKVKLNRFKQVEMELIKLSNFTGMRSRKSVTNPDATAIKNSFTNIDGETKSFVEDVVFLSKKFSMQKFLSLIKTDTESYIKSYHGEKLIQHIRY